MLSRALLSVVLLIMALPTFGLQAQVGLKVGFVVEQDLETSSVADLGPDGVSRLSDIFVSLGAQTQIIRLNETLPEDIKVIVLPRPLRRLSTEHLARLWRHLEKGNHLLFTIDPIGYPDRRIEESSSGFNRLLNVQYGVGFLDTFLSEPWFSKNTLTDISGSIMLTYGDFVSHPVADPLLQYDVSVAVWGARTLNVEPFGISSFAHSLLITNTAYGETNRGAIENLGGAEPLEINVNLDHLGALSIAALGENVDTQSRIAVLGDSELLQNGFGLAHMIGPSGEEQVRFPGNVLLIERIAAWLLGLPVDEWPSLPVGFTWVILDGNGADWSFNAPVIAASQINATSTYQVRGFQNTDYLYLLVDTPNAKFQGIQLMYDTLTISARSTGVTVRQGDSEIVIPDARLVKSVSLEMRIPQRVFGNYGQLPIRSICLYEEDNLGNCTDAVMMPPRLPERDPASIRIPGTPLVTVNNSASSNTNLRNGPGTDFPVITSLPNGFIAAALGRNETADWVYVANARYVGWLAAWLLTMNGDINLLPVVGTS